MFILCYNCNNNETIVKIFELYLREFPRVQIKRSGNSLEELWIQLTELCIVLLHRNFSFIILGNRKAR